MLTSQSDPPVKEVTNSGRNFLIVRFEREVARVIEMDFRVRVISPERLRAAGQEERVAIAPDSQQWRPLCAEIFLELWIESDVARIIQKEVEMDLVIAGTRQQRGAE